MSSMAVCVNDASPQTVDHPHKDSIESLSLKGVGLSSVKESSSLANHKNTKEFLQPENRQVLKNGGDDSARPNSNRNVNSTFMSSRLHSGMWADSYGSLTTLQHGSLFMHGTKCSNLKKEDKTCEVMKAEDIERRQKLMLLRQSSRHASADRGFPKELRNSNKDESVKESQSVPKSVRKYSLTADLQNLPKSQKKNYSPASFPTKGKEVSMVRRNQAPKNFILSAKGRRALRCVMSRRDTKDEVDEDYQEYDMKNLDIYSKTCSYRAADVIDAVAKENMSNEAGNLPPIEANRCTLRAKYSAGDMTYLPPKPVLMQYSRAAQASLFDFASKPRI